MQRITPAALLAFISLLAFSCKKNPASNNDTDPGGGAGGGGSITPRLSYGDSIFYIKSASYEIAPNSTEAGTYSAFPDNLRINSTTGKITVQMMGLGDESQTGLKYKIKFQSTATGKVDSTYIILSGINYIDRIYNLAQHDTIISPIYNANVNAMLPSGTYGISADNDLAINSSNGQINIRECIRRGLFDLPLEHGEWEELTISYKANDNSNGVTNRIDIALYYYDRVSDIPSNITTVMRAHQKMVLGVSQPIIPVTSGGVDDDLPDNLSLFKPRPPCVIVVGQ